MNRTRFCLSKFYSFPCDSLCWEREQHRSVRTFFLSSRSITRQTGEFLIEFLHLIKLREKREAGILLANDSFSYISGGSLRWSIFFLDFLPDSLRSPFLPCAAAAATSSVALNHNRKYPSLVTGFAWVVFVEENRRRHRCAATEREWEKERGGGGTRSAARFYQFDESIYIYIFYNCASCCIVLASPQRPRSGSIGRRGVSSLSYVVLWNWFCYSLKVLWETFDKRSVYTRKIVCIYICVCQWRDVISVSYIYLFLK